MYTAKEVYGHNRNFVNMNSLRLLTVYTSPEQANARKKIQYEKGDNQDVPMSKGGDIDNGFWERETVFQGRRHEM